MGRICRNQITDHIREHFKANPLRAPEARIQPMCVLEIQRGKQTYLGEFKFLTKEEFSHELPMKLDPVAGVSDERSTKADFGTGFDILGGFLKVLGADPASVGAGMKKAKKMAFSFSNVRRRYIDPLQFGQILSRNNILGDKDNFMLHEAMNNKRVSLALITDVIISNNFSVSTFSESEVGVDLDVPTIANAVAGAAVDIKVEKKASNEVKFEAPHDLTFAFSALEISIDPATGKFSRGNWLRKLKSIDGKQPDINDLKPGEEHMLDRVLLDKNEEFQLLIEL
jgi:hypothetical protein